jgi:hypothetical protein
MTTPTESRITGTILLVIAALTLYAAWPVVEGSMT